MEKYIKYDFSDLERIMFNLKSDQSPNRLRQLKEELNRFFKDSVCKEVIYTVNRDKVFFGASCIPFVSDEDIVDIVTGDEKKRINTYYLEIDSKLLELGLTARELVAVILHEVGHLVADSTPTEEFRKALNVYLSKNNEHLVISDSIHYKQILIYAYKDSVRKLTSLFFREDDEIIADQFSVACGYGEDLESAYRKIMSKTSTLNRNVGNKLLVLQWTLRMYKDLKIRRIGALHTINKMRNITGSSLEKRELNNVSRAINQIDDDTLIQEATNIFKKTSESYRKFKYKGIRRLEDDLYEYSLRAKTVDEEDEALMLIRELSLKISMIDDYMMTEKLSESERERWSNLMRKYQMVREELSKKDSVAKGKFYGLFIDVPTVRDRYSL